MSASAFISYSREDSEFALRLAQDLKAAGANVWLDQIDIIPGHPWDDAVEEALNDSPQMLVILTPLSAKSPNVRNEISYALDQGKIIVPVLYKDCVVPLQLQRNHRIDFRADYAHGLASLLDHLHVARPDPAVLQKAAEGDAQRHAAWQAREAEAQRLRDLQARYQEANQTERPEPQTQPNSPSIGRAASPISEPTAPNMPDSPSVFLCHASQDAENAMAICMALERAGVRCWIAPRDSPNGRKWEDATLWGIVESKLVICLLSTAANQSQQVQHEIQFACEVKGKPAVAVRLEEVQLSGVLAYHLGNKQWLDATLRPIDRHIWRVVERITAILETIPGQTNSSSKAAQVTPP